MLDVLTNHMGITELGFKEEDGMEIIIISKKIGKIECFLEQKKSGKYFIYQKEAEMMLYPEDYGYSPTETKKEIYLKPNGTPSQGSFFRKGRRTKLAYFRIYCIILCCIKINIKEI